MGQVFLSYTWEIVTQRGEDIFPRSHSWKRESWDLIPVGLTPRSGLSEVNRLNRKLRFEHCITSPRAILEIVMPNGPTLFKFSNVSIGVYILALGHAVS